MDVAGSARDDDTAFLLNLRGGGRQNQSKPDANIVSVSDKDCIRFELTLSAYWAPLLKNLNLNGFGGGFRSVWGPRVMA
jgi:hypothetical protein